MFSLILPSSVNPSASNLLFQGITKGLKQRLPYSKQYYFPPWEDFLSRKYFILLHIKDCSFFFLFRSIGQWTVGTSEDQPEKGSKGQKREGEKRKGGFGWEPFSKERKSPPSLAVIPRHLNGEIFAFLWPTTFFLSSLPLSLPLPPTLSISRTAISVTRWAPAAVSALFLFFSVEIMGWKHKERERGRERGPFGPHFGRLLPLSSNKGYASWIKWGEGDRDVGSTDRRRWPNCRF